MGLFDRFKKPASDQDAKAAKPAGGSLEFNPAKAKAWFERATTVHETGNVEYAMTCWLSGLRFDPANIPALEGFFKSAADYRSGAAGKAPALPAPQQPTRSPWRTTSCSSSTSGSWRPAGSAGSL